MSAYALPGIFPPLPLTANIDLGNQGGSNQHVQEQKINYSEPSFSRRKRSDDGFVQISVKQANIDSLLLIQSLMSNSGHSSGSSSNSTRTRRCSTTKLDSVPPQELAMQFELQVLFQGRQYTVVRSLCRIRQLREELLDELKNGCSSSIPELPALRQDGARSFSLLQAILRSYVPTLEDWFRTLVKHVVPSGESPTLAHFLLEPLCLLYKSTDHEALIPPANDSFQRRTSSLESIEELLEEPNEDEE
jgi:hypothetical protein